MLDRIALCPVMEILLMYPFRLKWASSDIHRLLTKSVYKILDRISDCDVWLSGRLVRLKLAHAVFLAHSNAPVVEIMISNWATRTCGESSLTRLNILWCTRGSYTIRKLLNAESVPSILWTRVLIAWTDGVSPWCGNWSWCQKSLYVAVILSTFL